MTLRTNDTTNAAGQEPKRKRCADKEEAKLAVQEKVSEREIGINVAPPQVQLVVRNPYTSNVIDAKHLAIVRPFIIARFGAIQPGQGRGSRIIQSKRLWESLEGSEWQEDPDVARAALASGLMPDNLKGLRLLQDERFLGSAIPQTVTRKVAKELWDDVISEAMTIVPSVAFAAFERGLLGFTNLPGELPNNKKLVLEGLESRDFSWKKLPTRYKKNVEFALSFRGQSGLNFF